jgi:SPP1 gp7 family putative phage head morphogenesis protein
MFVRLIESAPGAAEPETPVLALADPVPTSAFLRMPFEQALAWWVERGGDPDTLRTVLGAYRERSAQYTRDQLDTVAQRAIDEITRTLDSGGTLQDFQTSLREETYSLGIEPATPTYLENCYRTQVASAYGAGRWQQMNDPAVLEARPYRQWRTAQDSRVRSEHAVMDGVTWRADDPAFSAVAPPAGFQCRCSIVTLDDLDMEDGGYVVTASVPSGFTPTPGRMS